MNETLPDSYIVYSQSSQASIFVSPESKQIVIQSHAPFISGSDFKDTFNSASEAIARYRLKTCIFDKRSLLIFHQPSLIWYYKFWKPQQLEKYGVDDHRKILPKDELFKSAVRSGFELVKNRMDTAYLNQITIQYYPNLSDAIADKVNT
jgi:hypothetical protein